MRSFGRDEWAVILGGSSGMGLAAADKLSRHGMSIFIVHRDRKGAMARIQPSFDAIAARGGGFRALNLDALSPEGQAEAIEALAGGLGDAGRVKLLLHSIAFANLRLVAPAVPDPRPAEARAALASALGIDVERVTQAVAGLFAEGTPAFVGLADPPRYGEQLLEDEDLARTVHAMGTSLVSWVQALHRRGLFAGDARVIGLTSEGNRAAWRGYAAAAAAKAALESAARAIAVEFAPHGIRCNLVQPGVTRTAALALIPGHEQMIAHSLARNPFRRLTTPEDVAGVICLLCTDEASWINGALIAADGGERLG
jgi:NAD(P)-dependent dehydrogenase (short-subunit alcohol dehydrogenase family)